MIDLPTVVTLDDAGGHAQAHQPSSGAHRDKATWHYVAARLTEAAHGGETIDIALPLRMVISRRAMPPYHWASNGTMRDPQSVCK